MRENGYPKKSMFMTLDLDVKMNGYFGIRPPRNFEMWSPVNNDGPWKISQLIRNISSWLTVLF